MNEQMYLALAGAIVAAVVQAIKQVYTQVSGKPLDGKAALWVTYGLAIVAAVIVKYLLGTLVLPGGDPGEVAAVIVAQLSTVIGTATIVYKSIIAKDTRGVPIPTAHTP